MLSSLKNIFKVVDLRNKILFTLFVTLLYRLGSHVTVPGIDFAALVGLALQVLDGGEVDVGNRDVGAKGLVHKHGLVKVLGRGELTRTLQVSAHAFSKSAEDAITAAGGTVEVLPLPFGHGRPPAKGNALSNR